MFITKDIERYEPADVRKIWSLALLTDNAPTTETMKKDLQPEKKAVTASQTLNTSLGG